MNTYDELECSQSGLPGLLLPLNHMNLPTEPICIGILLAALDRSNCLCRLKNTSKNGGSIFEGRRVELPDTTCAGNNQDVSVWELWEVSSMLTYVLSRRRARNRYMLALVV